MELKRLARVLRERWKVVVLVAFIGFLAGFGLTTLANRDIAPRFAAEISVRFDPDEGETADDLASRVADANQLALLTTQEITSQNPTASVFPESASGRLVFSAEGESPEEALSIAEAMVTAYFNSDGIGGGDVNEDIANLVQEASEVAAELDSLEPGLTPEEQALLSRHELLDQTIAALQGQIVAQTVNGALGTDENGGEDAIANLEQELDQAIRDRSALPPRPQSELSPADELRRSALQRRLDLLTIEYESLALRSMGVGSAGIREAPDLIELTPDPSSPILNGVIGFFGGLALALAALIFITRSRRELWLPEDVPIPVLGEVPQRRVSTAPGPSWYDSTFSGERKEAIQALRTAVDGLLSSTTHAIAIAADRTGAEGVYCLAADLAASFASSGRSVLLVDADFAQDFEMTEFDVGEPTLGTMLNVAVGPDAEDHISALLDDVLFIRTDLAVVASGSAPHSPADSLAGRAFRLFIEESQQRFDLVIVVAGETNSATAQVLMQRVGTAVVAITPGKTTIPRINSVLGDLHHQRVDLPGAVMLYGSESRLRIRSHVDRDTERVSPRTSPALGRLGSYPFPGSKRTDSLDGGSLKVLSSGLSMPPGGGNGSVTTDEALGAQVLEELKVADPDRSRDLVSEYVMARTEDMLTAVSGQASISQDLVDQIAVYGFIPITHVKGHPTIGEWFISELVQELGDKLGMELSEEFAIILGGDGSDPQTALNSWISREFFQRHLQRTDREPEVWHVCSSNYTLQLLVGARRLNEERIHRISAEAVRRKIDELERSLKSARDVGDTEEVESLQAALKEVHEFGISLSHLTGTGSGDGRLVYPWRTADSARPLGWNPIWSEGIRPNIAPLQRLGILAEPVLTDDEMSELVTTVDSR